MFIGRIVTRFGSMIWSMLTLILNQKLGFTASQVSVFMLIFAAVNMVMVYFGGKLADFYSKKKCIIYFDIVSVVLYYICAFIPLSNITVAFIVFAASCQWAERPAYDAIIADITTTEDREKAYALQYLGTNIGLMIAPTLAGILFKNHLPLLFIICATAIGISTVLIGFKVKNLTPIIEEDKTEQLRRDGESLWKILSDNKVLILYVLIIGFYAAGYDQYNYLMPLDLGRIYGEDGALLFGTVGSTNCIIVVIFSSIILKKFATVGPESKFLISEFLLIAGFIVFILFINYIPAYYIAIALFTFGEIFECIAAAPFKMAHTPASHRGRIEGFCNVVVNVMDSLLILVVGWLYDNMGSQMAWSFAIVMLAIAVVLTFILKRIGEKKGYTNAN